MIKELFSVRTFPRNAPETYDIYEFTEFVKIYCRNDKISNLIKFKLDLRFIYFLAPTKVKWHLTGIKREIRYDGLRSGYFIRSNKYLSEIGFLV